MGVCLLFFFKLNKHIFTCSLFDVFLDLFCISEGAGLERAQASQDLPTTSGGDRVGGQG